MIAKTDYSKSEMNWTLFTKAIEAKNGFYLFVVSPNRQYYIIPKRAFSSHAEEASFGELLRSKSLLK